MFSCFESVCSKHPSKSISNWLSRNLLTLRHMHLLQCLRDAIHPCTAILNLCLKNDEEKLDATRAFRSWPSGEIRKVAKKAVEELIILHYFSPNDPWALAQLHIATTTSTCLKRKSHNTRRFSTSPGDKDTLYKLGTLIFLKGWMQRVFKFMKSLGEPILRKQRADSILSIISGIL